MGLWETMLSQALWNKRTGEIDHAVADYMRDHGYDQRGYAETHWVQIGPQLTDNIFIWVEDMDNFYLNLAVYDMDAFLSKHPEARARFEYGRPEKGHGWFPWQPAHFIEMLADHIARHAPTEADKQSWHY